MSNHINFYRVILGKELYDKIVSLQDIKDGKFLPDNIYIDGKLITGDVERKLNKHLRKSFKEDKKELPF